MSDDMAIHDLLDRAVRDHSPATVGADRIVVARARREHRRMMILTVAATLAVVLGLAVTLDLVGTQDRNPVAGSSPPAVGGPSGRSQAVTGRDGGIYVPSAGISMVATPPGWLEFEASAAGGQDGIDGLHCPPQGRVVYRGTISRPGSDLPCLGVLLAPYIWERGNTLPVGESLVQTILEDGSPRWVSSSTATGSNASVLDVYFPAKGQSARAVGLSEAALIGYLEPAPHGAAPFRLPDVTGLSVSVGRAGEPMRAVRTADLPLLLAELPVTSPEDQSCQSVQSQYQIEFRRDAAPTALLVVDNTDGCASAVSSLGGGSVRVSPALVSLLARLSLGS